MEKIGEKTKTVRKKNKKKVKRKRILPYSLELYEIMNLELF